MCYFVIKAVYYGLQGITLKAHNKFTTGVTNVPTDTLFGTMFTLNLSAHSSLKCNKIIKKKKKELEKNSGRHCCLSLGSQ